MSDKETSAAKVNNAKHSKKEDGAEEVQITRRASVATPVDERNADLVVKRVDSEQSVGRIILGYEGSPCVKRRFCGY